MKMQWSREYVCAVTFSVLVFTGEVHAGQARFVPLGDLPGGTFSSEAQDLSADGSVVVGVSNSDEGDQPFRWTQAGGLDELGGGGEPMRGAHAISANGVFLAGTGGPPPSALGAATGWVTDSSGLTTSFPLGFLPGGVAFSRAFGISNDGEVAVGLAGLSSVNDVEAFRWTSVTGMVGLGFLPGGASPSQAHAVSANGGVIVGAGANASGAIEAFRWTSGSGLVAPLGTLSGDSDSVAMDVSANGNVVVGWSGGVTPREAFLWLLGTNSMQGIGTLPGAATSEARGVSRDGNVVVGTSDGRAFLWNGTEAANDPSYEMVDIQNALTAFGIDLSGWTLVAANAVGDDGETVAGYGVNPAGDLEAFLATVPTGVSVGASRRIATGRDFSCAVLSDASLVCWGNFNPDPDPGGAFTYVSAGETHLCAIRTNGLLFCEGVDPSQSGKLSAPPLPFVRVAAGGEFTCGLLTDGSIECFGLGAASDPPGGSGYVDIGAGLEHACAVGGGGNVVCWGDDTNQTGKASPPPLPGPATRVAAGDEHTCLILANETALCFGQGTGGQGDGQATPLGGTYTSIAAGSFHTCGTRTPLSPTSTTAQVVCWGRGSGALPDGQANPPGVAVFAVDAGGMGTATGHSCAILPGDDVLCWGQNNPFDQACPPGDTDCDGWPDSLDNCPDDPNFDQFETEDDGIGDVCDLCVGTGPENFDPFGAPRSQADEDGDGVGDLCDPCLGDPRPACDPTEIRLVDVNASPFAGGVYGASATTPEFDVLLDCGSAPSIEKAAMGIVLPVNTDPNQITFGIDCDTTGCVEDPTGTLLSAEVDGPSSFVVRPGDPAPPGVPTQGNPNYLYFSLRAKTGSPGLCDSTNRVAFLAKLVVGDLATGIAPPLTTEGAVDAVGGNLVEGTGGAALDAAEVALTSGDGAVEIEVEPLISAGPGTPPDPELWTLTLKSDTPLATVFLAFQGDGDLSYVGCDTLVPDPCIPSQLLQRNNCNSANGTTMGTSAEISTIVDYSPTPNLAAPEIIGTYTLGPAPQGVDLSSLPGAENDTLYVVIESRWPFGTAFGPLQRTFNPSQTMKAHLGTLRFAPNNPSGTRIPPALVFGGIGSVLGQNRQLPAVTCTPDPNFTVFKATDPVNNLPEGEAVSALSFAFGVDPDQDALATDIDLCPFTYSDQSDTGGVEKATNPGGVNPNGRGNECECGDVIEDDGRVLKIADRDAIRGILLNDPPVGASLDRCSTLNPPSCGPEDWAVAIREQENLATEIQKACAPALP